MLFFSNLPSDGGGHVMLVAFMYVANIGKKRINATLLNILLGVLVLRSKRNKRKTSLNMILCIEDDGVVKSEATGKQILN